ncbi:MAG: LrgB family protein [Anaerostipes sp.]|nr:LrgB family protein [Anaerostipes sp.]MDD4371686.1 LrgB family protein [Anaerostipes sp.]
MRDIISNSSFFGVMISVLSYELGLYLKKKYKWAILNPLLISIVVIILFLIVFHIKYDDFNEGAKYLSYLLTPATVCLAIPLYEQIQLLKDNWKAILAGILAGVMTTMCTVLAFAVLFHFTHEEYVTMLPKSITTAIGMGLSEEMGGIVTITIVSIIITGVFGNVIADVVFKIFGIHNPIAKGIGLGSSAHAIGTAKAMEMGEIEGAMSSLSIAVTGLMSVIFAAIFAGII